MAIVKNPSYCAVSSMGFLLPCDQLWSAAHWISRAFFSDAEHFFDRAPLLTEDIKFCIQADLDTVDLRDAELAKLRELSALTEEILAMNRHLRGSNFHHPEWFPVYLEQLERLKGTIEHTLELVTKSTEDSPN